MKNKVLNLTMLFLLGTMSVFGQNKTEKIKVYGNCGMCENRIEKAAKSVDGVTTADWDKETKMLALTFDESKTNIHKVHMAVSEVGHDTDMHKAKDDVYNNLPGCCKYDRPTEEKEKKEEKHNH